MSESLSEVRLHAFVPHPPPWLQPLRKHDTREQVVTDSCAKCVDHSWKWTITVARMSGVLSSTKTTAVIYPALRNVTMLQEHDMWLTTTLFIILPELYFTHSLEMMRSLSHHWDEFYLFSLPSGLRVWCGLGLVHAGPQKKGQLWDSNSHHPKYCPWWGADTHSPTPFVLQPIQCQSWGNITARLFTDWWPPIEGGSGCGSLLHSSPPVRAPRCPLMTAIIQSEEQCWQISMKGEGGGGERGSWCLNWYQTVSFRGLLKAKLNGMVIYRDGIHAQTSEYQKQKLLAKI